jgi:hypothetical protein
MSQMEFAFVFSTSSVKILVMGKFWKSGDTGPTFLVWQSKELEMTQNDSFFILIDWQHF